MVPVTINPEAVTTDEFAMAGLVRLSATAAGNDQVHDSPDLLDVFARPLFEAYLSSMYLLLDGNDAFARLDANDKLRASTEGQANLGWSLLTNPHWGVESGT